MAFYELMINKKRSKDAVATFVSPAYVQHNPLIPDGADALGDFFAQATKERAHARVVVHRIIAVGDYVWVRHYVVRERALHADEIECRLVEADVGVVRKQVATRRAISAPCKTSTPGSNPGGASNLRSCLPREREQCKFFLAP